MDDDREVGAPAKLSDLYNVRFSSTFVFELEEVVLVARSRGGFTYGIVKKIVSRKQNCYMDKNVNHTILEYKVLVQEEPSNTKGLPACYIGKLNLDVDAYDEDEDEDGEFDVKERNIGGKPIPEDLRTIIFGVCVVIPKIGDYILVPRSRGGFCYGIIEKQVSTACPISDQPRHNVVSYRAAINSDPTNPLHKDMAAIFLGLLINPRASSPSTAPVKSSSSSQGPKAVESQPPKILPEKCGECEEQMATLECKNCSEFYCADCCDIIHSKGQRKLHKNIVPVARSKPQVFTSAANAGQQMISMAKSTSKPSSNALPGFDLSSIFAAPNLGDFKTANVDSSKPIAIPSGYTPSPFVTSSTSSTDASPPHSPKSKPEDPSSSPAPKQKQIFPRGSRVNNSPGTPKKNQSSASPASATSESKKAANPVVFDDDDSDGEPLVIPQPPGKGKAAAPVLFHDDDDSDTEIKTLKRPPIKGKAAAPVVFDDDDSDTEIKTLKRPPIKGKAAAAPVVFNDDDSDTEIKTLKRPTKVAAPVVLDDDDSDTEIKTLKRPTKAVAPIVFNDDDSDTEIKTLKRPSKKQNYESEDEGIATPRGTDDEDSEILTPRAGEVISDGEIQTPRSEEDDDDEIKTLKRPSKQSATKSVPFQKASSKSTFSGAPTLKRPNKESEEEEEEEESEDEGQLLAAPRKLTLDSDEEDDEDFGVITTLKRPSRK